MTQQQIEIADTLDAMTVGGTIRIGSLEIYRASEFLYYMERAQGGIDRLCFIEVYDRVIATLH